MRTPFVRPAFLFFLSLSLATAASAEQMALSGAVTDTTGQPLPRVRMTVKSDDRIVATTFADERGAFRARDRDRIGLRRGLREGMPDEAAVDIEERH